MAAVTVHSDFGAQENKSVAVPIVFLSICREVMGPDASRKPEHFSFGQCSESFIKHFICSDLFAIAQGELISSFFEP